LKNGKKLVLGFEEKLGTAFLMSIRKILPLGFFFALAGLWTGI